MKQLKRSELHKMVWSKPMTHLAKEFGLSDVALAKICKKHGIPRPIRGFWARRAAGQSAKVTRLPAGENVVIQFDTEANQERRKKIQQEYLVEKVNVAKIAQVTNTDPHELGERVAKTFEAAKAGDDGLVKIRRHTTPSISASPACADRIVKFISGLAHAVEEMGIQIISGKEEEESVRFIKNKDIIHLNIEEQMEDYEVEPTPEQKRKPSWTWNNRRRQPTGCLVFSLRSPTSTRGRCKWTESASSKALDLLPKIAARMNDLFESWKQDREASARREAQWAEERRRRDEAEVRERHAKEIENASKKRRTLLLRASEWFKTHQDLLAFIEACEARWSSGSKEEKAARAQWLKWARDVAESLNPLNMGYPDPNRDGDFNKEQIPVGGPYPETRKIPLPHSVKEIERLLNNTRSSPYGYRGY